jgi:hypothetical protein
MNGCQIKVGENYDAKRVITMLLPPRSDQIIQPDFSKKGALDIDKELQLSETRFYPRLNRGAN